MTFLPGTGGESLDRFYDSIMCYKSSLSGLPWCDSLFSALQTKRDAVKTRKIFNKTSRKRCKTGQKVLNNAPVVQVNIPVKQSSDFFVYEEIPEELFFLAANKASTFLIKEGENAVS